MDPPVTIVAATRFPDRRSFNAATLLGRSLIQMPEDLRPQVRIAFDNQGHAQRGLPEIYNESLDDPSLANHFLVFIHDDVYLHDWFIKARVADALQAFDVVGIAGSVNPRLDQPSWALAFDADLNPRGWQQGVKFSGAVNHGSPALPNFESFGPSAVPCQLLDGLFLAVNSARVSGSEARFDPQFRFHCYDIDFCRSASAAKLGLGTWPIAVTHSSGGNFAALEFKKSARAYLEKWRA